MNRVPRILRVDPTAGIPGGEIAIECEDLDTSELRSIAAIFEQDRAHLVGASSKRVLAIIPEFSSCGDVEVQIEGKNLSSESVSFVAGSKIADDLHPVTNPAFDPDDGSLYVTRSGSRGQQFPVSIYKIDSSGQITDYSGDITNPTGIAFDSTGQMFVTSRLDGTVYRFNPFNEAVPFARNLGIATGIAFDSDGSMYVGDRTGTIYQINDSGEERIWAQAEPSVSAYHLAIGPDDVLYMTGPTVSSFDCVTRFDRNGNPSIYYRGLGRPQGLAFDTKGNLFVAASSDGRRGVVRIPSGGGKAELAVAGMNVVGLAFSADGDMVVATTDAVYRVPIGIQGSLLG